jgi:hypothetical protein
VAVEFKIVSRRIIVGSLVKAHCRCGYERKLAVGGGMTSHETLCSFPVYCPPCKALFQANLFAEEIRCPTCKGLQVAPYDDESMCEKRGNRVFSWSAAKRLGRTLILTDGNYLCPECNDFSMHFEDIGCWD